MALWRRILPTGFFSCSTEVMQAKIAEAHDFTSNSQGYETVWGSAVRNYLVGNGSGLQSRVLKNHRFSSWMRLPRQWIMRRKQQFSDHSKELLLIELRCDRLSTVRNADRIYVMEQGKLVEWGGMNNCLSNRDLCQPVAVQSV